MRTRKQDNEFAKVLQPVYRTWDVLGILGGEEVEEQAVLGTVCLRGTGRGGPNGCRTQHRTIGHDVGPQVGRR